MSFLEEMSENWKLGLVMVVLLGVNVLTFLAQETNIQHERDLSASLAREVEASAKREVSLLATSAAQSTQIARLESALKEAGLAPAATGTPAQVVGPATPTKNAATATPRASTATPTPPPATIPSATATSR